MYGDSTRISSYRECYRRRTHGLSLTTSTRVNLPSFLSHLGAGLTKRCSIHRPQAPSDVALPSSNNLPLSTSRPEASQETGKSPLGEVPHQIRGFLAGFNNLKITGQAYNKCTGCSDAVRFDKSTASLYTVLIRSLVERR